MPEHFDVSAAVLSAAAMVKAGGDQDELKKQLLRAHPQIAARERIWQDIDDVMDKDIKRQSTPQRILVRKAEPNAAGTGLAVSFGHDNVKEFRHLPKGTIEPWSEYNKRVAMTPFFPETPRIVATRRGAMFANEPQINVHDDVKPFLERIGPRKQTYLEVLDFISTRVYTFGLMAVAVDFRPLPLDIRAKVANGEKISQEEVDKRQLNSPVLGLFTEREILDFSFNPLDGCLEWVKFRETRMRRGGWMSEGDKVEIFRIFGRKAITTFEIRKAGQKSEEVFQAEEPIIHGHMDDKGDPAVPVVIINPFGTPTEIGDSPMRLSVEADLAKARVDSDLFWNMYVHGNPQLVLKTPHAEDDSRLAQIGLGSSKYIPILAPNPTTGQGGEDLFYLQLDGTGLIIMQQMSETLKNKANELASNTTPSASTEPKVMSGVAKAWDFKTGEEKALHEHVVAIENASNQILKMLTRRLHQQGIITGTLPEMLADVKTSFQPSFDPADPVTNLDIMERVFDLAGAASLPEMQMAAARRVIKSISGLTDDEKTLITESIKDRLESLIKAKSDTGGSGGVGDEGTITAMTLGLERAVQLGDVSLAEALRARIAQRLGAEPPEPLDPSKFQDTNGRPGGRPRFAPAGAGVEE